MEILIVSGLSGAGKSQAVNALEDMSFYCVDNMPPALLPRFVDLCLMSREQYERVALVTDIRAGKSFQSLFDALAELESMGCDYKLLFVEANMQNIVKRYKETRRRHPLEAECGTIEASVEKEIELLDPVRDRADYVIDTSDLTLGQLQDRLYAMFSGGRPKETLSVRVISFGFKHGIPMEADLVFDVRFMPNPFYIPELREKTGLDRPVEDYVFSQQEAQDFMDHIRRLMEFLLPNYMKEGKTSLTVCVGCTGGHHRSVAIAQRLASYIEGWGYPVRCSHRDIKK